MGNTRVNVRIRARVEDALQVSERCQISEMAYHRRCHARTSYWTGLNRLLDSTAWMVSMAYHRRCHAWISYPSDLWVRVRVKTVSRARPGSGSQNPIYRSGTSNYGYGDG